MTHRYLVESDVSDVIVGAALPRVVEPEAESTGVSSIQCSVFTKRTILHVDWPVVDLHATDGEITAGKQTQHTPFSYFLHRWKAGGVDGVRVEFSSISYYHHFFPDLNHLPA